MSILHSQHFGVRRVENPNADDRVGFEIETPTPVLLRGGMVLDVSIGIDKQTAKELASIGGEISKPRVVTGLIDTGAAITSVRADIADSMGLKVTGASTILTAGDPVNVNTYAASLEFPNTNLKSFDVLPIVALPMTGQNIEMLIGRDLMQRWIITYNGVAGSFTICD